jgi:hypothetical protein
LPDWAKPPIQPSTQFRQTPQQPIKPWYPQQGENDQAARKN